MIEGSGVSDQSSVVVLHHREKVSCQEVSVASLFPTSGDHGDNVGACVCPSGKSRAAHATSLRMPGNRAAGMLQRQLGEDVSNHRQFTAW